MDLYEKFRQEIYQTVENLVNGRLKNINTSIDVATVVTGISNGKYKVTINGNDYWVKDGVNISPTIGMAVWVHVPNGKYTQAFIMAKR